MSAEEHDQEQTSSPQETTAPTITRRGFLKGLGMTGVVARFGRPLNLLKTVTTPFVPATTETNPGEVTQKVAELQQKYGVNITTFDTYLKDHPDTHCPYAENGGEKWDIDRLNTLDWCLQKLPPHFHRPASNGERLSMVLAFRSGLNGNWIPEKEARLDIGYNDIDPQNREDSLIKIGHESIHWITPIKVNITKEGSVFKESPWFDQIYQILGGNYANPPEELSELLLDQAGYANTNIPKETNDESLDGKENYRFLGRLNYGINQDYPNELLGVMGEHYLQGQDYFIQRYSGYVTTDQAVALYNFMQTTVFLGQQYNNYSPITSLVDESGNAGATTIDLQVED